MMTIISRAIIGASVLISIFCALSQVAIAQKRVQAIMVQNLSSSNITLQVTAENTRSSDMEPCSSDVSLKNVREKANDLIIAQKIHSYVGTHNLVNNNANFIDLLPKIFQIFSDNYPANEQSQDKIHVLAHSTITIPVRILEYNKSNKLTLKFSYNDSQKELCTIECITSLSKNPPINCQTTNKSGDQVKRCVIDKESLPYMIENLQLQAKRFCNKKAQTEIINTLFIIVSDEFGITLSSRIALHPTSDRAMRRAPPRPPPQHPTAPPPPYSEYIQP